MSQYERSGWRDMELSARHRLWGKDCPAADLDWLVVEYNHGLPVALVEYKHYLAKQPNLDHPTYRAIRRLADHYDMGALPFWLCAYWPDTWGFRVYPVNDRAHEIIPEPGMGLTERQYVNGLYKQRRNALDRAIALGHIDIDLQDIQPPQWDNAPVLGPAS